MEIVKLHHLVVPAVILVVTVLIKVIVMVLLTVLGPPLIVDLV